MIERLKKWWYRITGKYIEENIYMKSLELGFESGNTGVSILEVVDKLKINLNNKDFELNYVSWFYTNFYHPKFEQKILGKSTPYNSNFFLNDFTYKELKEYNSEKSYLKGDALNKYIDFLELKRTRKASRVASIFSALSVGIATFSVVYAIVSKQDNIPLQNVIHSEYRDEGAKKEPRDSLQTKIGIKNMDNSQAKTHANRKSPNKNE